MDILFVALLAALAMFLGVYFTRGRSGRRGPSGRQDGSADITSGGWFPFADNHHSHASDHSGDAGDGGDGGGGD